MKIPDSKNRSATARYQAAHRVIKTLPKEKTARQQTLMDVLNKCNQKIPLNNEPLSNVPLPKEVRKRKVNIMLAKILNALKKEGKEHIGKRQFKTTSQMLGFSGKRLSYFKHKNLKEKSKMKKEAVQDFFKANARILSDKRHVKKNTDEAQSVLEIPIEDLYKMYQEESDITLRVSKSFFFKNRPKSVKKMDEIKFNQCLCEICENFQLTLRALSNHSATFKGSKHQVLSRILCEKSGDYHQRACIFRTCQKCDNLDITRFFPATVVDNVMISHSQWLLRETERGVRKKVLVKEEESLATCFGAFKNHMIHIPEHLFFAQWQYKVFREQQGKLQQGDLLTVMDFAENYRCAVQDEIQSAYWSYQQATVHPFVNYLLCHCGLVKVHTVVIISDDLLHDFHAVEVFWAKNVDIISKSYVIHKAIQWSDGCGVQYKSRGPFSNIQLGKQRYGFDIERNFFGSRHGKNPSDGVSANVKNKATRAVKCRQACIQNAADLHQFLTDNMTVTDDCDNHRARTFVFVGKAEILRNKIDTVPVKGTRKLHVMKSGGDGVKFRNLSCVCEGCNKEGVCERAEYVDDWQTQTMFPPGADLQVHEDSRVDEDLSLLMSTSTLEYLQETEGIHALPTSGLDDTDNTATAMPKTSTPSKATATAKQDTLHCTSGSYVRAKIHGVGGIEKAYYGMIQTVLDGEYEIKFMVECGDHYVWPWKDDIALIPVYDVINIVDAPRLVGRGRYEFPKLSL